jgi:hypothetical protein
VELLRRYSNRPELAGPMIDVLRRIEEGDKTDVPDVESRNRGGRWPPLEERLGKGGLAQLVADRRAGARLRDLVEKYGICESTVKRVLKRART